MFADPGSSVRHSLLATFAALATLAASAGLAPAQATVIFGDDFNKDGLSLNTTKFHGGWTVTSGSVDIHGSADYWDVHPGNGRYVDLDGSTQAGGTLTRQVGLDAGVTYTASYWLGGSGRGDTNIVDVSFGTAMATHTLASDDTLALAGLLTFTPEATGSYDLTFVNRGGDNLGAILDNVTVTRVPEPSSLALAVAAVGLLAGLRRRRAR